jgi:hypothetical protein
MKEFEDHIEFYKDHIHKDFSLLFPEKSWGDVAAARVFMDKYWLPCEEYLNRWKPKEEQLFLSGKTLPGMVFQGDFRIIAIRGGSLFAKEDFEMLQRALLMIGETDIVIVQCGQEYHPGEPMFRMKFPVNILYEELMLGNYISAVLFEMSFNDYYVYGSKGTWAKYVATDFTYDLDLIAVHPTQASNFVKQFDPIRLAWNDLERWLPLTYRDRMVL